MGAAVNMMFISTWANKPSYTTTTNNSAIVKLSEMIQLSKNVYEGGMRAR